MQTEDRSWAIGLSELEFIQEYQKKFNIRDVIPTRDKFLNPKKAKEEVSFNLPYRDEYLGDPKSEAKTEAKYKCNCGECFAKPLDKARHVKGCKTWQKQTT